MLTLVFPGSTLVSPSDAKIFRLNMTARAESRLKFLDVRELFGLFSAAARCRACWAAGVTAVTVIVDAVAIEGAIVVIVAVSDSKGCGFVRIMSSRKSVCIVLNLIGTYS